MTPDIRKDLLIARIDNYTAIMRTTIFTMAAIAAMIEFGPGGYSAPLITLTIAATLYGILAGGSALDDMIALRADMDEATANSNYGKAVAARNLPMLKMVSTVLLALVGLAEVAAILI